VLDGLTTEIEWSRYYASSNRIPSHIECIFYPINIFSLEVQTLEKRVIYVLETYPLIRKGLDLLVRKKQNRPPKKHGNIPL
jgi:hypothetical protein